MPETFCDLSRTTWCRASKSLSPGQGSRAECIARDLVNGLTAAYCHEVSGNNSLSTAQKRSRLNVFGQLAYTEAVHCASSCGEKGFATVKLIE